jgi:hypothetical protein
MEIQAFYAASADAIVTIHTLFVGFVVIGQLLILVGLVCRWKWVRNPWFRVIHLLCIGIVATEAASGIICPLTVWERDLRGLAGQTVNDSAVGWFFNSILFFNMPREFFVWIHISFGALVLGTFVLGPPRFRRRTPQPPTPRPLPSANNRKAPLQPSCDRGSLVG